MKFFWITLGWIALVLGVIGAFLPLLPTTPFLLLAAWSFSQGSEKLHLWIMTHPKLSPPIIDWQENRAIQRSIKVTATFTMLAMIGLTVLFASPLAIPSWAVIIQAVILTIVAAFLWTRPEVEKIQPTLKIETNQHDDEQQPEKG
ncbi:MAG: YbaN family protein [Pseudomonadales bacterium]|jgi:uncharacterized protein|nr:YbaN family protein [Pseudomonadales bacterium]